MEIDQTTYGSSSVNSLFTGHTKETEKEKDPLGRDAFLTMLVAQLQHQDPLNPMEGTDFTAQLAQFSSLEQQFNTNDSLEAILSSMDARKEDNLIDYIGKQVVGVADAIALNDGTSSGGQYTIESGADILISIFDQDGNEIHTIYEGQKGPGTHQVDWKGENYAGETLSNGTYTFGVMALSASGGSVPVETAVTGEVTGVTYEHGVPYLQVGERLLDPSTVTRVWLSQEGQVDVIDNQGAED